jgi:O-antigen/teichoic acid export membrane protein
LKELIAKGKNSIRTLWKKGAFHILIGNFATKFVTFFGSIALIRMLTKTDFGLLGYMENIYSYAFICSGLGLYNALLRYSVLSKEQEKKYSYYKYALIRGFAYNVLIVVGVIIFNMLYKHPDNFTVATTLIPLLILALPFQDLVNTTQMNERAMLNNRRFAIVSVGSSFILVVARILGAYAGNLFGVIIGIVVANISVGIYLCVSGYRRYFKGVKAAILTKFEKRQANVYAFQYMITNGLWAVFMLMDVFLLGRLLGDPTVVAEYKTAYTFAAAISIVGSAIAIFVTPYFIKNENNLPWVRRNYIINVVVTSAFVGLLVLFIFVFARPIILVSFGAKYSNVTGLMRVLLISSFINNAFRASTANLLAAMGQIKYNMIISAIGLVLQVTINLMLIPKYAGMGAAYTGIIVYGSMSLMLFTVFNRKYKIIGRKNKE